MKVTGEKKEVQKQSLINLQNGLPHVTRKKYKTIQKNKLLSKYFLKKAKIHPKDNLIKGVVYGYRIEEIDEKFNNTNNQRNR